MRADVEPSGTRRALTHRCSAYTWSLGAALLWATGCSGPPDERAEPSEPVELGVAHQAATFPALASWIAIQQANTNLGDPETDGQNNGREVIGNAQFPAVFIHSDDVDFKVRLRLNETPLSGANVRPFGWGLLFDTDGNFSAYEFSLMIDGTGNPRRVVFAQNTTPGTTGSPSDTAETELSSININLGVGGNVQVTTADSTFGGNADFFLDFATPLSVLKAAGINLSAPLRVIAGTSSSANSISVDLAGTIAAPGAGTLELAASDPTYLDGTDADMDGDSALNPVDLDNDNDGITDVRENSFGVDPDADGDADGVPNWRDASNRGDGVAPGCTDAGNDGICDTVVAGFDRDGDRIPNHNDLDSDNDGIADLLEAGHGSPDANADGMVDGSVGANGFRDSLETSAGSGVSNFPLLDTDDDLSFDFLDLNSDGDALFDVAETGRAALDANTDGRIDTSTTDADRDGILSNVDVDDAVFGFPNTLLPDIDNDGIPNTYDKDNGGPGDSDADGISDAAECPAGWPCLDGDGDGTPNYMTASVDADGDGVGDSDDVAPANPNRCRDVDADTCDDCTNTGANSSGGDTDNDGPDVDGDGQCDAGDVDADNDGVPDAADSAPANPNVCRDTDNDTCNDCALTGADQSGGNPAGDGLDTDGDGQCNAGDLDDDNDGVADLGDLASTNPNLCRDTDTDTCDDCALTGANLSGGNAAGDGLDTDGDGQCNAGDLDDDNDGVADLGDLASTNPNLCRDTDTDTCDDCALTGADESGGSASGDGLDTDGDGQCNAGDLDDDNDGVADTGDLASTNPNACRDTDTDTCDDCALTGANLSGGSAAGDGLDTDGDGQCNAGDLDDDNDGVADLGDLASTNPNVCRDTDTDTCDDCALSGANLSGGDASGDGLDTDGDGQCNAGDLDDDDDGVADLGDLASTNPNVCRDTDTDTCDDCALTGADENGGDASGDGLDTDGDGRCNAGDLDDDDDGVADLGDLASTNPNVCRDTDTDTCDDCALTGADESGGDASGDGLDTDGDGRCDAGELDDDDDGVADVDDSASTNPNVCRDSDNDSCDDCVLTGANGSGGDPSGDGLDTDADGRCDAGDLDDDDDGVADTSDLVSTNPNVCRDSDNDSCDDCVLTGANESGGDAAGDGLDTDADGQCDAGDLDDDGDGVVDVDDSASTDPNVCRDTDDDSCDDCTETGADGSGGDPGADGLDTDSDGLCNTGDEDSDDDGVIDGVDVAPLDPLACQDSDLDSCDDCTNTGADASGGDTDNDGADLDQDGTCDAGETDVDGDGVADPSDAAPANPVLCRDVDVDTCDDCVNTGADGSGGDADNDGPDLDQDGVCDAGEIDFDDDGVPDELDVAPAVPSRCRDLDNDTCDDCSNTGADLSGGDVQDDGADFDQDGICDAGETDRDKDGVVNGADAQPLDPQVCRDLDNDGCDDCAVTGADRSGGSTSNDGADADADGVCDAGDDDDDNDGTSDPVDVNPLDPVLCADVDQDGCGDCSITGADHSGGDPENDGLDTDGDTLCDAGDADDDNDGVPDVEDSASTNPSVCRDVDTDTCDDCVNTGADQSGGDVADDGADLDQDGTCDAGEADTDGDGVPDPLDGEPTAPQRCRDVDNDTCDDCSNTGANGSGGDIGDDGQDSDDDGTCDAGEVAEAGPDLDDDGIVDAEDPDVDGDGVPNGDDSASTNPQTCGDIDGDTCDDCANTGADQSGGDVNDDGPDADQDGICDAGETDEPEPVESYSGVHVQGGGFNCSLQRGATDSRQLGWPLALLLGLAYRRKRASSVASDAALNR